MDSKFQIPFLYFENKIYHSYLEVFAAKLMAIILNCRSLGLPFHKEIKSIPLI
jgi:hypothetical protein